MPRLSDAACRSTKSQPGRDIILPDENGLYLRIRPGGTKVWVVEYMHRRARRKVSIGQYDPKGSGAPEVRGMLEAARLSLAEARFIAATWNTRPSATSPTASCVSTWTVRRALNIQYRLDRLLAELGDRLIAEITRHDVTAAIEARSSSTISTAWERGA